MRRPDGVQMRAGVRGPRRSGPRTRCRSPRRVGARLDHPSRSGGRQATKRRGAGPVCATEASASASATARRCGDAGRDMNAAAATPCRVHTRRTARPTRRKRPVRGEERQRSNEWSAGQNRDGQADATSTKRGFAALKLRLHG